MNNKIFRNMSYGVYIVGTMDGTRPTGCVANSIMQITSKPATIALSINHDNYTNARIEDHGFFSFSIMAENSPADLIGRFGFQSGRDVDKFDGVNYEIIERAPVLKDTLGYVVCKVINKFETSTHTVYLGLVIDGDVFDNSAKEMTYSYYHNVIKGKSPAKAPTYIEEEKAPEAPAAASTSKYECQICHYVYEGDELPANYKCPICSMGADKFKKID